MLGNLGLQKRISLLVLTGLVVGLSLFSFLGVESLNDSTKRILDQRLSIARIIANHIDETLTHVLTHLQSAANIGSAPTEAEFNMVVGSLRHILGESGIPLSNVILTDKDGVILRIEPENPSIVGVDVSQLPEMKRAFQTGQPSISNLLAKPLTEVQMVLAIAPIVNGKGDVVGTIAASIDIEHSSIRASSQIIKVGSTGYVEIVDGNGLVLARTEPGFPPKLFEKSDHPGRFAELIQEGKATVRTCHRCHETSNELQRRRDVLAFAPLAKASWGVVIRQSEEEALAPTRELQRRLLFLGLTILLATFFLVWIMMQSVLKPIKTLTAAAKRVATGDFKAAIPLRRADEIGQLSQAFHTMTQELATSRDELVSRNKELSALNSIIVTVSQSLDLKDVLGSALQRVLEVTGTIAGCIFLIDPDDNKLKMMIHIGMPDFFKCHASNHTTTADCVCYQVLRHRQTVLVNDVSQCPKLDENATEENIASFVSIPLKSKNRTIGIMNLACSSDNCFTENDFKLLDSIGYHIGLAIENSVLYEEAKEKEELRGQLLSSVISAQEEERKRISRELHDEFGQTLTAAMMNIESLENQVQGGQSELKEKVQNAKSLMAHALEDIRRLTHDLRPSALDDLGLISSLRAYAQNHLEAIGIQVKFESKGLSMNKHLAPVIETALFRIVQEAINNIIRHAQAHNVRISLSVNNSKIRAVVEDDGKGFDVDAILNSGIQRQSLGLIGIKERAALLGGTFNIKSQKDKGTRLVVEIPLPSYHSPVLAGKQDEPDTRRLIGKEQ